MFRETHKVPERFSLGQRTERSPAGKARFKHQSNLGLSCLLSRRLLKFSDLALRLATKQERSSDLF
jgi:hypothetical protein